MIKVTKWDKEKRKESRRSYRAEIRKQRYGILTNVFYVLKEIWKSDKLMLATCFLFALGLFVSRLCATYTDKYVVELAMSGLGNKALLWICIGLITLNCFFSWLGQAAGKYQSYVGFMKLGDWFDYKLMKKNMTTDYENNEKAANGNCLSKARDALSIVSLNVALNVRGTLRHVFEIFTYGVVLSFLDIRMVPIIMLPAVICFFIERHKMNWVWNMADNWQGFERQLSYIRHASCDFASGKDVRIFGMQDWFEKVTKRSMEGRLHWNRQEDAWAFRHNLLSAFVNFLGNFAAYGYVIYLVLQGNIGAGDFVLYFNSIMKLKDATSAWCENMSGYQWLCNNINFIREYLELEDTTNREEGVPLPTGKCEIEFRNVSYTYFGAEEPTIKNLSFKLHKGEKLALVGLNGAGKTTIVKLMCGLYDPTEGEILLNGVNVKDYNREEYFRLFSAVFQESSFLAASIAENMTGQVGDKIDRERMLDCMKRADIYEKVMSLPEQESTMLVRSIFKNATDFSGGEKQKLSLAKALYKDAPVLLLDEPTAALDAIAEQKMYLNYMEFAKEKTSLFISHRLASTRFCDRILLLENGQVTECGSHRELMEQGGRYADLFEIQSSYYREGEVEAHE